MCAHPEIARHRLIGRFRGVVPFVLRFNSVAGFADILLVTGWWYGSDGARAVESIRAEKNCIVRSRDQTDVSHRGGA